MDEGTALEQFEEMRFALSGEAVSSIVQDGDDSYSIHVSPLRYNTNITVVLRSPRDVEVFQETAWLCAMLWT